jgi:hypothetical protein
MKKTLLIFGFLIIASITASAQVCQPKVDTTTGRTIPSGGGSPYPTFNGWKHPVSGNDRLLIVQVTSDLYSDSVKYAGLNLVRLDTADTLNGSKKIFAEIWYLLNPPSGTDSVKVFYPAGTGTFNSAKSAQAISFENVDQGTPFGTTVKYKYNSACPTSFLVLSDTNSLVLDLIMTGTYQYPLTKGASQQKIYTKTTTFNHAIGGSVQAGADSVYMDWTWTFCAASTPLAYIAIPIKGICPLNIGINEIKETAINLFPNPVSGILHYKINIKENTGYTMEVVDITGKILLHEKANVNLGNNQLDVNVSALTPGMYFLKLINTRGVYATARFIKTE